MRMFMYPNKQTRQCFPVLLYESSGTTNDQMFMCHVLGIGLSGTAVKTSRKANITFQGNHSHIKHWICKSNSNKQGHQLYLHTWILFIIYRVLCRKV